MYSYELWYLVKLTMFSRLVQGFEPRCFKRRCFKYVLYRMIHSLPRQGTIPCIELGIELKKKKKEKSTSNYTIIHFTKCL